MLIDVLVGETNLEEVVCCFILCSWDPFEGDIVGCEFQTPPVYLIICVLAIKELC